MIGGIFFLLPLFIVIYVIKKTYGALEGASEKIVGFIGFQKVAGVSIGPFVTVALFVLICFTFGLLAPLSARPVGTPIRRLAPRRTYSGIPDG